MAPTDDNSVPGINVAGKNGAAFPVMGNAATGAILVASAGRGTGAISNAPKDANHVSGLVAKDKATGKAFAVQGNKDTGAIFVQDLNGGGGGGAATWGSITGDISDNAELTAALDKKANKSGDTLTGIIRSTVNALPFIHERATQNVGFGLNIEGAPTIYNNTNNKNLVRISPTGNFVKILNVGHFYGTGQPNGRITAPAGSTYTDTDVTCGAVKWIKMWGTGNTGWTVLYGDTGWRDIKSLLDTFWDNTSNIQLRRINKVVYLRSNGLKVGDNPTGAHSALKTLFPGKDDMPLGFRNAGWGTCHAAVNIGGTQLGAIYSSRGAHDFSIRAVPGVGNWTKGETCSFNLSYVTENDWPTVLPGGVSG